MLNPSVGVTVPGPLKTRFSQLFMGTSMILPTAAGMLQPATVTVPVRRPSIQLNGVPLLLISTVYTCKLPKSLIPAGIGPVLIRIRLLLVFPANPPVLQPLKVRGKYQLPEVRHRKLGRVSLTTPTPMPGTLVAYSWLP